MTCPDSWFPDAGGGWNSGWIFVMAGCLPDLPLFIWQRRLSFRCFHAELGLQDYKGLPEDIRSFLLRQVCFLTQGMHG